jgi:hypothetical protein
MDDALDLASTWFNMERRLGGPFGSGEERGTAPVPPRAEGELAPWSVAGRAVRTGTWAEQAESTPERIERAVSEGRGAEAEALVRHLIIEAQEIHDLYTAWCAALPAIAGVAPRDPEPHAAGWQAYAAACEAWRAGDPLERVLELWTDAHDRHLEEVADLIDLAVEARGEASLGEVWSRLQAEGRAFYRATYGPNRPWPQSYERLIQVAIEGMHGHLGGPRRRGEVTIEEHPDRISLSFHTCGSGGRLLEAGRHGVVRETRDFAWSTPGVCRYCVHCCVLQQLGAIDDLGYPARVIEPPTIPGDACTWSVYRDPRRVPPEAYTRVGRQPPG